MKILGLVDNHDTGTVFLEGSKIANAVNEERLSRVKLDSSFPSRCLKQTLSAGVPDAVAVAGICTPFYLVRKNYSVRTSIPDGMKESKKAPKLRLYMLYRKLFPQNSGIAKAIEKPQALKALHRNLQRFGLDKKIYLFDHHLCHAASAYYTGDKNKATIITADGAGDGLSATVSIGCGGEIEKIASTDDRNSVAYFYGRITQATGFKINRHEGKITGLAAFGDPSIYYDKIKGFASADTKNLRFKTKYDFVYNPKHVQETMKLGALEHKHLAAAVQRRIEDVTAELVQAAVERTGYGDVVLAGGLFANVKINQRILELENVKSVFVHPHMGDGGIALGAALQLQAEQEGLKPFRLKNVYFGPEYSDEEIKKEIKDFGFKAAYYKDIEGIAAECVAKKKIVGRFSGRMEYGPRALGNRSILADPTDVSINDWLNKRLNRTEFMPFAPSILDSDAPKAYENYVAGEYPAEFMTITFDVNKDFAEMAPAVNHVDNTARPQVVTRDSNESYHKILRAYKKLTGLPLFVNTSFNAHEEPIVCSPRDALNSLVAKNVDVLVIGNYLVQ